MYHAELNMEAARRRVRLAVLGDTRDGDVFYLVDTPFFVYRLNKAGAAAEFEFQQIGSEQWLAQAGIGSGDARQRVVIIHNTRITIGVAGAAAGG